MSVLSSSLTLSLSLFFIRSSCLDFHLFGAYAASICCHGRISQRPGALTSGYRDNDDPGHDVDVLQADTGCECQLLQHLVIRSSGTLK